MPIINSMRSRRFLTCAWIALWPYLVVGCASTPPQPDVVVGGPRIVSLGIDARDYNKIAKSIYDSLAQSGRIEKGKVTALGPIKLDLDSKYDFKPHLLQEKIQVHAHRAGVLNFTFAVDAMAGNSAAEERYKIMQLQWEKESAWDPEELRTWGSLADVDYLLFGRLTTQTQQKSGTTEVTYTYNWKLGKCETGLLTWTDEVETTKSKRR